MNDYQLWFAMAKLSYKIKNKLIDLYGNAENIWYAFINESIEVNKAEILYEKFRTAWNVKKIDEIKRVMYKDNIEAIVINDELYPEKLRIYDEAPYMLFYKGDIDCLFENTVSIVGSRKATYYGENITKILCDSFADNNITVVSGMAKGIDTYAHEKILAVKGKTCAVLGSGVNVVYPKENYGLYEEITQKGCVISQFLPGEPPYAYNFPVRNKIISALSSLIIVVEASDRSGSLITAGAALEQGKDVMAVPGDIFSKQSVGCNKLIKDGAYVLTSLEDVYEVLKMNTFVKKTPLNKQNNVNEASVYSYILNKPLHINDLLKKVNLNITTLYEVLFNLELKKKIMRISGDYYVRVYDKM
ncbi:DNA-processing protein DprA [Clostridium grantii]|uniref:DNA processing protein n=1 Tax=Clostridium grantii DSM 8605 TaxID=1121316 RepID=A0A1M5QVJ8_9CLOT|nr:DNA-processing protein DprA [Clostridium grantii]SHH18197.1 DNA processing protein [Clostridium grantii DSM 8605]